MSLDSRARHAVRGLQDSVVLVQPLALPAIGRRHRASIIAGLAGALAIAFASIALASILPDGDRADTAGLIPSTIPDPELPGLVVPDGSGDPEVEFGVHQKNSSSTNPEPYTQFYGTAAPGTTVVATSAFGTADLVVGESGEFSLKVWFESPPVGVPFAVTLQVGDTLHEFQFTALWDPQNVAIDAHQTYGTSDSPNPFEKFFGSAPPGTLVEITSLYGSASTAAGEEGQWYQKVYFSGAPVGEPFDVTVTAGGESFSFSFLWIFDSEIELTVHQEGTSSSSASPYTRFVGTAPAGTHILATSSYGAADLEVGESGEFSLKVWFSGAPKGVKFPISFQVDHEPFETFYFTSNYEPNPTEVDITQYNTESWDPQPWIKFYGSAPVGTALVALSPYGNADMTVGSGGEVYFKLYFSTLPPAGEPFTVTLKVDGSVYGNYQFTSHYGGESGETVVEPIVTSSDSPEPYAKVEYSAPSGTTITLLSEYGSASVTTEWTGSGHLKLWFTTPLPAGEHTVTIKVNHEYYDSFTFTYVAGEMAKTANATHGRSSETPPFDVYYGTAPAGTTVTVSSPYSDTVQVVANGEGNWATNPVYFYGATIDVPFTVTVNVGGVKFYLAMEVTSP